MIVIDGRHGGGQVLRNALALSILTHTPIRVVNIRADREKKGVQAQHLASIRLAAQYARAHVEGAALGSMDVTFTPSRERALNVSVDIPTAGSTLLALQSILPALILEPGRKRVVLVGGTDVPRAPSPEYYRDVLFPLLTPYAQISLSVVRRGYYPKGGGRIDLTVESAYETVDAASYPLLVRACHARLAWEALVLKANASHELAEKRVLERAQRYAELLAHDLAIPFTSHVQYTQSPPGGSVTLILHHATGRLGVTRVFQPGVRVERLVRDAMDELREDARHGCEADAHAIDMLIPLLIRLKGKLCGRATRHVKASVYTLSQFTKTRVSVQENVLCITREEEGMLGGEDALREEGGWRGGEAESKQAVLTEKDGRGVNG